MRRELARFVVILVAVAVAGGPRVLRAQPVRGPGLIRGTLIDVGKATPEALASWKADGGNAVIVPLDVSVNRATWSALANAAARAGLDLYPWIDVARNRAMADAHPEWMASPGGHHADWRRRFPHAPTAGKGEVLKLWPWVPIGYTPAFEAHSARVAALLDGLPGGWSGVFLNDLQAGPSSCGCGNDQCRWALDYGSPPTTKRLDGDDVAAQFVAKVRGRFREKTVIPVWVTECEVADLPGAAGGTGHCGTVHCASADCWPRYARAFEPLRKSTPGPIAVGLWTEAFGRKPGWSETGLALFLKPPKGEPFPAERAVGIVPVGNDDPKAQAELTGRLDRAGVGWVVAKSRIDESWEPRVVKVPR
jgi:hypothetical protein